METETIGDAPHLDEPPKYGLKLPLNHVYPLQSKQMIVPRANQVLDMLPLTVRYLKYYMSKKMSKKRPIMDYVHMVSAQRMYGCPIGGIGGGTIGRGFKGEFCRFQLFPGLYEYITVPECQFIVNIRNAKNETIFQSVLSTYDKPKKAPQSWEWNLDPADCEYTALYPRAWTTYDLSKYGVKLVCRQISPVIPHNYKDSSMPCAVFVFSVKNVSNEHKNVSITFTWTEIQLQPVKKKAIVKPDLEKYADEHTCGVTLEQKICDTPCTFTIAKKMQENETIHDNYCLWNAAKTSKYIWDCIKTDGQLSPDPSLTLPHTVPDKTEQKDEEKDKKEKPKKMYKCDSIALSSTISLDPGGVGSTEFCLAWDMPTIKYKTDTKIHKRYYTKYFGSDGIAGAAIASYALRHYKKWEKQLLSWQDPILHNNQQTMYDHEEKSQGGAERPTLPKVLIITNNFYYGANPEIAKKNLLFHRKSNIPDWLKGALMNELYFIADGGTVWYDVRDEFPESDPRHEYGLFGYLEGHEYRMYNTYDVHFYASFALAQLWPNLQVVIQYMYRDAIDLESEKTRRSLYDGKTVKYKVKNSIPHDLGDPDDVPFTNINCYNIHDVSEWRDLNLKFVLQVVRDVRILRGYCAPLPPHRYRSMAFIDDDVRDGIEPDLYMQSTGQMNGEVSPSPSIAPEIETQPPPAPPQVPRSAGIGDILELLYRSTETEAAKTEVQHDPPEQTNVWDCEKYLADLYPSCCALLRRAAQWDTDGDGLIENSGLPDQTFDAWVMTGPSAYCGGLWLAALSGVRDMAKMLEQEDDEREFSKMLEQAQQAYDEKLWTGSYYCFDTKPFNRNVVMADQLAGQWFLRASGSSDVVFPHSNVKKALGTIYENNVQKFVGGRMGAVNGWVMGIRGHVDTSALQSEEAWTGVTYGLASLMIFEGMHEEAFATAGGMHKTLTEMGLTFETPEALYENGNHRSIAYMRPLAIWGMYQAIVSKPPPPTHMVNGIMETVGL